MNDDIPQVPVEPARRSVFERASVVWLVPVAALLIALGVAWNTWMERGPLIEIAFEDAAGISANETELKYRNVSVGVVERVRFTPSLDKVVVSVRLDKDVAPFVDGSASFWIVTPQVTTQGITGLETVLSGVYIEGAWDDVAEGTVYSFDGQAEAPLARRGQGGLRIELRSSSDAGMTENTPIVYKGIEVGRIGPARISQDGRWVFADGIVYAPHDRLVSTATRFWDTSGFSFTLGPAGAELDFSSLSSLIAGGITFDTLVSGGQPASDGMVFEVFSDESSARTSIFEESDGTTITLALVFEENVSGLVSGAPVEWQGVRIGEVVNVTGLVDPARFGDARVRLVATIELRPARFGLPGDPTSDEALDYLSARVIEGLRARLVSASILTGGLKVEFISVPDVPLAEIDRSADPFPVMPVTRSEIADVSATAEGVFQRINALPVEELLDSAIAFLDNATAFVTSEDMRNTPTELRGLLSDARGVIGSDEVQRLPAEVSAVMSDLQAASADLRALLTGLREAEVAAKAAEALDRVSAVATAAESALADVPGLVERVSALADKANALPIEDLTTEATALAGDVRALLGSEDAKALPAGLRAAVASLDSVLTQITEAKTAEQLSTSLTAATDAARSVETAVAGVPDLVAKLDGIAANAQEVELDKLAQELTGVLEQARSLFGQAGESQLPEALAGAFREAEAALSELRAGGAVENTNATLASARDAAAAIEAATADLPALVERANQALAQAQSTLAGYAPRSDFARQTEAALREIQRAADAVADLSRSLERRPNSIILGR